MWDNYLIIYAIVNRCLLIESDILLIDEYIGKIVAQRLWGYWLDPVWGDGPCCLSWRGKGIVTGEGWFRENVRALGLDVAKKSKNSCFRSSGVRKMEKLEGEEEPILFKYSRIFLILPYLKIHLALHFNNHEHPYKGSSMDSCQQKWENARVSCHLSYSLEIKKGMVYFRKHLWGDQLFIGRHKL